MRRKLPTLDPHVQSTINRVTSTLYRLRRMFFYTDIDLRSKLISTLAFPLFDYCSATLGDLPGTLDSKLQVTLNSCVRYVFGLGWREHVSPYRLKLKWLSARNRRLFLSTKLLHNTLISSSPHYLRDLFSFQSFLYPTRCEGPFLKINFSSSQQ